MSEHRNDQRIYSERLRTLTRRCPECGQMMQATGWMFYSPVIQGWVIDYWCPRDRELFPIYAPETTPLAEELAHAAQMPSAPGPAPVPPPAPISTALPIAIRSARLAAALAALQATDPQAQAAAEFLAQYSRQLADPARRHAALQALHQLSQSNDDRLGLAVARVLMALAQMHAEPEVLGTALEVLLALLPPRSWVVAPEALQTLTAVLTQISDPALRAASARTLVAGIMADEGYTSDTDYGEVQGWYLRPQAIAALQQLGPAALPPLWDAFDAASPAMRSLAITLLEQLEPHLPGPDGRTAAQAALRQVLQGDDAPRWPYAAQALAQFDPAWATTAAGSAIVDRMIAALDDSRPFFAANAVRVLGHSRDQRARDSLVRIVAGADPVLRLKAVESLDQIDPNWVQGAALTAAVPSLIKLLLDTQQSRGERRELMQILEQIKARHSDPAIRSQIDTALRQA